MCITTINNCFGSIECKCPGERQPFQLRHYPYFSGNYNFSGNCQFIDCFWKINQPINVIYSLKFKLNSFLKKSKTL